MSQKKNIKRYLLTFFLILWVAVWLVPIWNLLATATKDTKQWINEAPWIFHPGVKALKQLFLNLRDGIVGKGTATPIGPVFINSLLYGTISASIAVFLASLAAYSLARLKLRLRYFLFFLIFSGTLFPVQIFLVPLFKLYQNLNLYDKRIGMIFFYISICIPFCLLVLRNWFYSIPQEIVDAAKLDGCNSFQIYLKIFIPLSLAPFATLFLLQFTWVWNDLIFGLTLTHSVNIRPVMTTLSELQNTHCPVPMPIVLSSTIIASLPILILILVFQRQFFRGLRMSVAGE
ncbi:MAG: carbohydrate ABC transporter permease [Promethearchaeota archaeon]